VFGVGLEEEVTRLIDLRDGHIFAVGRTVLVMEKTRGGRPTDPSYETHGVRSRKPKRMRSAAPPGYGPELRGASDRQTATRAGSRAETCAGASENPITETLWPISREGKLERSVD